MVGQGPQELEGTHFALQLLPHVRDEDANERLWYVVRGAFEERLEWWRPGVETTNTPVEWLWGPGTWQEVKAAVAEFGPSWPPDTVLLLDRIFCVRVVDGAVDAARTAAQLLQLRERTPGEHWFVVQADSPGDARTHVHRALAGACRDCECDCPAKTLLASCSRDTALEHAVKLVASPTTDGSPLPVSPVRAGRQSA